MFDAIASTMFHAYLSQLKNINRFGINLQLAMKRLFAKLIAVPIRLLAEAFDSVKMLNSLPLWSAVWKLSGDTHSGCKLLTLICKKEGIEGAKEISREMFNQSKDGELVATMGWLQFQCTRDTEEVSKLLEIARHQNFKNPQMLLQLELFVSINDSYKRGMVIEQVLERNDLPMTFTHDALSAKALRFAAEKRWIEAETIADRILSINEDPDSRLIKWMVCWAKGEQTVAEKHQEKVRGHFPDAVFNMLVGQGWLMLGETQKAMEQLYEAERGGFKLKQSSSLVSDFAHTEEFQNFCRQKEKEKR